MTEPAPKIVVKNSGYVRQQVIDSDGAVLTIFQGNINIPFDIKRIYTISRFSRLDIPRGGHAHKLLSQVIFCLTGSFMLALDDGEIKQDLYMDNKTDGVILGPELWHAMYDFSEDCLIMVAADNYYDESDYIRNYDRFIKYVRAKQ